MAELAYDAIQVPPLASPHPAPGGDHARPAPGPYWESVKSRPRAVCPTRKDRASTHHERVGQEIRVVLVDDHLSFRQPLAFMLLREPDITIVGQAGTVAEARPLLPAADIALIDLDLPDGEGVELIHELRAVNPHGTALVLTRNVDPQDSARVLATDRFMLLDKLVPLDEIISIIRVSALDTTTDPPPLETSEGRD